MKDVTLIMAYGPDGVLGSNGNLPWPQHREDMRRFREATLGSTVIMGRRTYESIGRPLPWRKNVVVSAQGAKLPGDVEVVRTIQEAIAKADDCPCNVIGGAQIYAAAMPHATRILLTEMKGSFEGDVYFKIPFRHQWREVTREEWRGADGDCDFVELAPV